MKKKVAVFMTAALLALSLMACGKDSGETQANATGTQAASTTQSQSQPTTAPEPTTESQSQPAQAGDALRIGSMKGPTSMGLVNLMDRSEKGEAAQAYEFTMVTAADELLPKVINGEIDIAMVPSNVASVLYNKTKGGISVIDINTLGVLYVVTADDSIQSIKDLKGKTVYMTGKGTVPDYVMNYLIKAGGLQEGEVAIEFKSEPTEVAAVLAKEEGAVGLLPQPFATVACAQNDKLKLAVDLTKEWEALQGESGGSLITGVTVVRNEVLEADKEGIATFLKEYKESTGYINNNVEDAAKLVVKTGIIEKEAIAVKAIPYCNITYIDGEEMKTALKGYLEILFEQNPESVGGALPEDSFYYISQ